MTRLRTWLRRRRDAAFARHCPTAAWVLSFDTVEELTEAIERGERHP